MQSIAFYFDIFGIIVVLGGWLRTFHSYEEEMTLSFESDVYHVYMLIRNQIKVMMISKYKKISLKLFFGHTLSTPQLYPGKYL